MTIKDFEVKKSGVSCLTSLFDLSNDPKMKILHANLFSVIYCFFSRSILTLCLVVEASLSELDDMGSSPSPRPFCVALSLGVD